MVLVSGCWLGVLDHRAKGRGVECGAKLGADFGCGIAIMILLPRKFSEATGRPPNDPEFNVGGGDDKAPNLVQPLFLLRGCRINACPKLW